MARCGCGSTCNCVFLDGDCIDVVGSGTAASPYRPNLAIDPNPANTATCGPDGLLVVTDVETVDTNCITLSGNGSGVNPLEADLVVDPVATNLASCGPNGLLTMLHTANSNCIELTGAGTVGNPLQATPNLSADIGNVIECRADGFFVPAAPPPVIDSYAILHNTGQCPNVVPPSLPGTSTRVFIDYDLVEASTGLLTFPCGGPAYAHTYIEVPVGGDGWYLIQATHPGWEGPPYNTGNCLWRLELWLNGKGIGQSGQTRVDTASDGIAEFYAPYMHVSRTIELTAGDRVSVAFSQQATVASGGATLSVYPIYGFTLPFRAGHPFFSMFRIGV